MKRFAAYYLPFAALVVFITLGLGFVLSQAELDKQAVHEASQLAMGREILFNALKTPLDHLRGLEQEPQVKQALGAPEAQGRPLMEQALLTLLYRNPAYGQARWLNPAGQEIARVINTPERPVIVPERDLRDKSTRPCHQRAIRLAPGQMYLSPLDLNVEQGGVEIPYRPMLRLALRLPVVDGRDQGLLAINLLAQPLLDHLRRLAPPGQEQHLMFLNPQGYWLMAPDPADAWGFMLGRDTRLGSRHPGEWASIQAQPSGRMLTPSGLWSWTTVAPATLEPRLLTVAEDWKLVSHISAQALWARHWHLWWPLSLIAASALVLLALGVGLYLKQLRARERGQAELAQALARMSRSETRLRTIFEQAPLGIALIDSLSGHIIEVNDRFATVVGRSREDMATIDWMAITHPDDVQEDLAQMARLNAGEIPGFQMNKRYLHPDGALVWVSMTIAPVTGEPGQGPRHLCMIEDITERVAAGQRIQETLTQLQEARRSAEAASGAKSEFLAHMSHEIRTPMNAVLGQAQLLAREPLNADQRLMVQRLQTAGQSLLGIINDILDFSKLEAGQLRLEARPFDLETLVAKLHGLLGSMARAKGLDLRLVPPAEPVGPLLGDPLRLEQVLTNLLGNALKFTERGEVALRITPLVEHDQGLGLRFAVQDTGIGIAPASLPRLFIAFSQADGSITRRFGGTGLGLAICKRLVEAMGGQIRVESTPGQGSTFWFEVTLPRAAGSEAVAHETRPVPLPAGPRLAGLHLLAVDDSAMNRDLVEMALSREGASVTLAADGQQAVQLLRASPAGFDAVLMDVQMPVMDGRTATRLIREELGLTRLPVIALTAGVLAEEQRLIREAGADEVLAKPLDLALLVATLLRLIPAERLSARSLSSPNGVADAGALAGTGSGAVPPAAAGSQAAAPGGPPASPDQESRQRGEPGMKHEAKILIVDDEPAAIQMMRKTLQGMGVLRYATGGQEALALVASDPPDLILLDANMPVMDGFATCRALQRDHAGIPVVFVTASGDFAHEIRALEAGASDFISKPINPPVVRARAAMHLKFKTQSDLLRQLCNRDPLTGVANRRALEERR